MRDMTHLNLTRVPYVTYCDMLWQEKHKQRKAFKEWLRVLQLLLTINPANRASAATVLALPMFSGRPEARVSRRDKNPFGNLS